MKVAFENPCTTACHRGEHVARTFQRSSNTMLCHSCGTDHCLWGEDYVGFACLIYLKKKIVTYSHTNTSSRDQDRGSKMKTKWLDEIKSSVTRRCDISLDIHLQAMRRTDE